MIEDEIAWHKKFNLQNIFWRKYPLYLYSYFFDCWRQTFSLSRQQNLQNKKSRKRVINETQLKLKSQVVLHKI